MESVTDERPSWYVVDWVGSHKLPGESRSTREAPAYKDSHHKNQLGVRCVVTAVVASSSLISPLQDS